MKHQQIFLNLPIKNMARTRAFFESMGYEFNPQFSNDQGACLVLGENLFAMLLTEEFFATFTSKRIIDGHKDVEALICVSCASKAEVDALVAKAVAAGGTAPRPVQDHGFMYSHSFDDLDGHSWELVHMVDASQVNAQQE